MHCISLAIISRLSRFPSPAIGTNWPFCVDVPLNNQLINHLINLMNLDMLSVLVLLLEDIMPCVNICLNKVNKSSIFYFYPSVISYNHWWLSRSNNVFRHVNFCGHCVNNNGVYGPLASSKSTMLGGWSEESTVTSFAPLLGRKYFDFCSTQV